MDGFQSKKNHLKVHSRIISRIKVINPGNLQPLEIFHVICEIYTVTLCSINFIEILFLFLVT